MSSTFYFVLGAVLVFLAFAFYLGWIQSAATQVQITINWIVSVGNAVKSVGSAIGSFK